MSNVTASMVKELRERTGVGMMECKKALVASNGDLDAAAESLRISGATKADKKAGRETAEGAVTMHVSADGKSGSILEVNSETDFVARDENFINFLSVAGNTALNTESADITSLAEQTAEGTSGTVEEARQALIAKIGENISLRRVSFVKTAGVLGSYKHGDRIAVLVAVEGGDEALAKDIAMHVAASKPLVVSGDDVPAEVVNKEKEIFTAQAQESGKPAEIIEKMIGGRIQKFLKEISLLGQPFVKNPDQTIEQLLKEKQAKIVSFVRYEVGEGIEKKEDNFVEEVMAQVQGNS